jgi:hypothetical protein
LDNFPYVPYNQASMKMLDVPQSGSIAGVTSSRNRYGQYKRTRAIPVNRNTTFQGAVRTRFASLTESYRSLSALLKAGWASLGDSITRTDSLGQTYTLTGQQAYMEINCLNLAAGNAIVTAAPAVTSPVALLTATITLSATVFSVAYTATPLGTGARLFVYTSPQRSPGRNFESDYRLCSVTAAAAASPADIFTAYSTRFGTPVVGNKVFLSLQVYTLGFLSGPLATSAIVA